MPIVCPSCQSLRTSLEGACARCGWRPEAAAETIDIDGLHEGTDVEPVGWSGSVMRPGMTIGGSYTIRGVVGDGGMSVVYRAWDHAVGREVAIKALHANLMTDAGIRRRFAREAKAARSIASPCVATVYDVIAREGMMALVLELVDGVPLSEWAARWKGAVPTRELASIARDIGEGLDAAHAVGVVHRDVKPSNVLVYHDAGRARAKLVDFGIAKILEGTTYTMTGALLGTTRYMAPEQVQAAGRVDHRADIYSLAVMLYELLCGRPPFEQTNHFALMMAHVTETPEPPSTWRDALSSATDDAVLRCLEKQPSERPASATDAVASIIATLPPGESELPVPDVSSSASRQAGELLSVEAGVFLLGPQRRSVWLDGYRIGRFPITNAQFWEFVVATGYQPEDVDASRFLAHWPDERPPPRLAAHPVVYVSWTDALAFAGWAGLRLPTEAEWEKAARGTDGRRFPWGRIAPDATRAHFDGGETAAVGGRPAGRSPYGAEEMAGNVWEWCLDVDEPAFYLDGPTRNPRHLGPIDERARVVRGGAHQLADVSSLRTFARFSFVPTARFSMVGFRCAD